VYIPWWVSHDSVDVHFDSVFIWLQDTLVS